MIMENLQSAVIFTKNSSLLGTEVYFVSGYFIWTMTSDHRTLPLHLLMLSVEVVMLSLSAIWSGLNMQSYGNESAQ